MCADKGKFGAVCDYTLPPHKVEQLPKLAWDNKRIGWLCLNPESFGDYQQFVETVCQKNGNCVEGVKRVLELGK